VPCGIGFAKTFDILPEDQISLNFDILRIYAKNTAFKNLCLLAKTTTLSKFIPIAYIVKSMKKQQRQIPKKLLLNL
jgi:hypothetical protein